MKAAGELLSRPGAYRAASARMVLDHDGLPELDGKLIADDAAQNVAGAAGRKVDDETNRPARISLRVRGNGRGNP